MKKDKDKNFSNLIQKQQVINYACEQLKKEFVGIDQVIDQVIDSISSWFIFPDLQEKPLIVNLWGLTGVGKSSLVTRLADLLNYKEKFYHFDLGEKDKGDDSIKDLLECINENRTNNNVLIALDEFQHASAKSG